MIKRSDRGLDLTRQPPVNEKTSGTGGARLLARGDEGNGGGGEDREGARAETGRRAARDLAQGSLRNLAPASKITMFAFVQ